MSDFAIIRNSDNKVVQYITGAGAQERAEAEALHLAFKDGPMMVAKITGRASLSTHFVQV